MHPYPDIHKPLDAGLMASPPNSADVDQTNGISASDALVRSAGKMLADSSPTGSELVPEGQSPVSEPQFTVWYIVFA